MSKRQFQSDPISLLRQYKTEKRAIKYKDGYLYFDQMRLPLKCETAWIQSQKSVVEQGQKQQKYYNLGSLWLYLEQVGSAEKIQPDFNRTYIPEVQKYKDFGVEMVTLIDRKEVQNYFFGKIDSTDMINNQIKTSQLATIPHHKSKRSPHSSQLDAGSSSKKLHKDNPDEVVVVDAEKELLKIIDYCQKYERPLESKNRALKRNNKSFKALLKTCLEKLKLKDDSNISSQTEPQTIIQEILASKTLPIILVPNISRPGGLCMKNALSLLRDGKYEEAAQQSVGKTIEIKRESSDLSKKHVIYEIRSDADALDEKSWKRVVAAVISGGINEFRKWPDGDKPAILFSKIKGFYFQYHDVPLPQQIKSLNVKIMNIQRIKRYTDMNNKNEFWKELEIFINKVRVV